MKTGEITAMFEKFWMLPHPVLQITLKTNASAHRLWAV